MNDTGRTIMDDETRADAGRLAERSTSVMEEFQATTAGRKELVEELLAVTEHIATERDNLAHECDRLAGEAATLATENARIATENDRLRQALNAARNEIDATKRRMNTVVSEAGELASHHRTVVSVLSSVLDVVSEGMRTQRDEDKRIEAAREIAFSRTRFNIEPAAKEVSLAAPQPRKDEGPTDHSGGRFFDWLELERTLQSLSTLPRPRD